MSDSMSTLTTSEKEEQTFDMNSWRFGNVERLEDELSRYLNASILILEDKNTYEAFELVEWWRGNSKEYWILACVAFDVYSIPVMSVEPERVFSGYHTPLIEFDS